MKNQHAIQERNSFFRKTSKSTGRYGLLSTGNVPAVSIMKRSVK